VVIRHLARVADRLPADSSAFLATSDATDAVILHLWQATQVVIDLALATCSHLNLGAPTDYADGFRRLETAGLIPADLASRWVRAAGFRNMVADAYSNLDMARVYHAAQNGPVDLKAFLVCVRDLLQQQT